MFGILSGVCTVTWNVDAGDCPPPAELARIFSLLPTQSHPSISLYVIALQEFIQFETTELDPAKIQSPELSRLDAWTFGWVEAVEAQHFGDPVELLRVDTLGSLVLITIGTAKWQQLLAHPDVCVGRWVTRSNTLSGIKGAIALSIPYVSSSLCTSV